MCIYSSTLIRAYIDIFETFGLLTHTFTDINIMAHFYAYKWFGSELMAIKRKKEISLALPNVIINKFLIEESECDYIRKMLNKNHMGKVPSKAAKR